MTQFLETISIIDGVPQHLEWHQRRVDQTLKHFYPAHGHSWDLASGIRPERDNLSGLIKCRIVYDAHQFHVQFQPYTKSRIDRLKIVQIPVGFQYRYKYAERSGIDLLLKQKGDADDILMSDRGWVMDTSIANIAFGNGDRWYTPALPLLAGTTWKRLVSEKILIPRPIHRAEISTFARFKLFNALNSFEDAREIPVRNII